ncbi:MAG: response regulator [Cellvibrionaceae bacterium]|nr:response regulator [Cellvibrionaceae bacterium]
MVLKIIKHVLSVSETLEPLYANSYAAAKQLVAQHDDFFAAVVDLNLPDAPDGEVVDLMLGKHLPTIVLTGNINEQRRELLLEKGIVDYVVKEGKFSYVYVTKILNRLIKNQLIKVLVVDDSAAARKFAKNLLQAHLFKVYEAADGVAAIKTILAQPDIRVLLTDYHMPNMDGFELVRNLRVKYEKSELIVIGVSSEGNGALSARFIKNGASDFLKKPYNHEEFYCRLTHNVEMLELLETVRDLAYRDELTGVHNRKYFFERGAELYRQSTITDGPLAVATLNLDGMDEISTYHGLEASDQALVCFAQLLAAAFKRFVFARVGVNEFLVLMSGLDNERAVAFVDKVRQMVLQEVFDVGTERTRLSFSAGVSNTKGDSLDEMLACAKSCLMRAYDAGGDLVMGDD